MVSSHRKVGRNDPCPCGSGKKFKMCCLNSESLNNPSLGPQQADPARSALEPAEGAIREYDPSIEPHSEQWLALGEQEQIDLVLEYHRRARIRLPRQQVHAVVHVVVENQIADAELPVRRTLQRLMSEGLDRHDAIHAIGSVLVGYLNEMMREKSNRDPNEGYFAELEALTAEGWLRSA
jgi:SEC-C motif